jgi:protoheme IX farnesyltransferase
MSSPALVGSRSAAADYLELTKPRITLLVVLTALMGYVLGASGPLGVDLLATLLGTALVAGGASALNMLL